MEKKQFSPAEERDNLRIVEHLNLPNLPRPIQQMLSLATTPEEQDMLLIATLAASSACIPKLYFRYGPTGKKYYANLQCFILATSASGKGVANQALEMVRRVDERYPLLISGDSTLAAWYNTLSRQDGCGYMHESEGLVITDIWKTAAANYNTALRKAAEHEPISRNRCNKTSEIKNPRLSMLLTGTFKQYRALVPSVENGYFSRLLTLVISETHPFSKKYVTTRKTQSNIPIETGIQLLRVYERLQNNSEQEWSLTASQKERLGAHLEAEYTTLITLLGTNFHSVVVRMAIQIERIALILSVLRRQESIVRDQTSVIYCSDEDYQTAELIGNKLLLHIAAAYKMIEGDKQELLPAIKPIDPRQVLYEQLKQEYKLQELIAEAHAQGVSRRSAIRWNESWQENGLVQKTNHGQYKKVG